MRTRTARYEYRVGRFGLVVMRARKLNDHSWTIRKVRYLGRGPRAQRIIRLLRERTAA